MLKIGLLSDTHGFFDPSFFKLLKGVDEIWHAGDIGSEEVLDAMEKFKPVRAVYGNIDGTEIRQRVPKINSFDCEGVHVFMTHIGGYPGKYAPGIRQQLLQQHPSLFIAGHSHILKVINDPKLNLLHVNPGAAGKYGFQTVRTAVRFVLNEVHISDMEVIELAHR